MEKLRIRTTKSIQITRENPDGSVRTRQRDYFILFIQDQSHLISLAEANYLIEQGLATLQEDEAQKAYARIAEWKRQKEKQERKEAKKAERRKFSEQSDG